jgi:hypothetical protein
MIRKDCLAAEDKIVEPNRDIEDCLAGAFEPKEENENPI